MSSNSSKPVSSLSAKASEPRRHSQSRKKKLSFTKLADLKSESQCKSCRNFGYWASHHNSDGSLRATVKFTLHTANGDDRRDEDSGRQALKSNKADLSVTASDETINFLDVTIVLHGARLKSGDYMQRLGNLS